MKKIWILSLLLFASMNAVLYAADEIDPAGGESQEDANSEYRVGVDDILDVNIISPDKLTTQCRVAPDGLISFPYIGNVRVDGMTLNGIRDLLEKKLSEGYMKYPVVSVSLHESRSRKFFVYGEVARPASYPLDFNTTVLKAVSLAGGFTQYASSSSVKVLRPHKDEPGYEPIKVSIKDIMNGDSDQDILIKPGDIVVVSEGIF